MFDVAGRFKKNYERLLKVKVEECSAWLYLERWAAKSIISHAQRVPLSHVSRREGKVGFGLEAALATDWLVRKEVKLLPRCGWLNFAVDCDGSNLSDWRQKLSR